MASKKKCLAKFVTHRGNGAGSCNDCSGVPCGENVCYHREPWSTEEKDALAKQDRMEVALKVLERVHNFLGEVIRDNLMEDTPRASDLADEVWDVLHWDDEGRERKGDGDGR